MNDVVELNCREAYTGIPDAFLIQLNTLIYVLQKLCGFTVRAFLISEEEP